MSVCLRKCYPLSINKVHFNRKYIANQEESIIFVVGNICNNSDLK